MSIASSLREVKGYIGELIGKLSGAEKCRAAAKTSGMSRNTICKETIELESSP